MQILKVALRSQWVVKHRSSVIFNPTDIYMFMYLPMPVDDVNDILVIFLFTVLWTDFLPWSAVSAVTELTCSN